MIRRALIFSLLSAAASGTARATETMICSSGDGGPEVSMLMGTLDVASIVSASIVHDGKTWATDGEGAMKIIVGQAFESDAQLVVDFTDEALSKKVAGWDDSASGVWGLGG
jgi:hypothetical protein